MTERQINIGITSSLILILIQLIGGFFELMQFDNKSVVMTLNLMNPIISITMFIVLWRVLVKYYNQSQLDLLIKSLILISYLLFTIIVSFVFCLISIFDTSPINIVLG